MKHFKNLFLLGFAMTAVVQPGDHSLQAAVPSMKTKSCLTHYYDPQKLQVIVDSLQKIDPRNLITPVLGEFIEGKIFFEVGIYGASQLGDLEHVTINKIGVDKNRCIAGALRLSNVITACAYDPEQAYVGVRYIDEKTEEIYFGTIMNSSKPNRPCKVAIASER